MNLVIDEAVEVQLVMKTNKEEKRRQLGQPCLAVCDYALLTLF